MKALTLKQPWAAWIARGLKTVETRRWSTSYRGRLLITASKKPRLCVDVDNRWAPFRTGCAICLVTLSDCRPMAEADADAAMCRPYEGAVAWILSDVRPIGPVVCTQGMLSLWTPPAELLKTLEALGYLS